ncbi:hypothetical protein KOI35_14680 [Actinoplanes bogorensis]|uniref:Glyoxalase n=1 Tax=Paractinoplanes bogorensis TaxID=1610840 RepID=A0ABS5YNX2_9ACTN|nr:hypothetical protein [Actinoplanes bogorensis]
MRHPAVAHDRRGPPAASVDCTRGGPPLDESLPGLVSFELIDPDGNHLRFAGS